MKKGGGRHTGSRDGVKNNRGVVVGSGSGKVGVRGERMRKGLGERCEGSGG